MNNRDLNRIFRLSAVPRWSVIHTIQKQSVSEHTTNVVALCCKMWWEKLVPEDIKLDELLQTALEHDAEEGATGDYPSPSKRPAEVKSDLERAIKIADVLEAFMFICRERSLGNVSVINIYTELEQKLFVLCQEAPLTWPKRGDELLAELDKLINLLNPANHPSMEGMLNSNYSFRGIVN